MGVEGGRPAVPDSDSGPQTRLSDRLEEETYNQNRIDPSGGGDAIGSPRSTAAAVRIQSVSRGKRARESVTQLRAERDRSFAGAADLSPGQGADKRANQTEEPSRGGDASGSPRSTAAAVRIQSVSRGKKARGRVAELRAEGQKHRRSCSRIARPRRRRTRQRNPGTFQGRGCHRVPSVNGSGCAYPERLPWKKSARKCHPVACGERQELRRRCRLVAGPRRRQTCQPNRGTFQGRGRQWVPSVNGSGRPDPERLPW